MAALAWDTGVLSPVLAHSSAACRAYRSGVGACVGLRRSARIGADGRVCQMGRAAVSDARLELDDAGHDALCELPRPHLHVRQLAAAPRLGVMVAAGASEILERGKQLNRVGDQ